MLKPLIKTNSHNLLQEIFGCKEKLFLDIIKDAYLCRIDTTKNHIKNYGGIKQYNESICFLREQLACFGFVSYENNGSNWAVSSKRKVAITAMAGNSWVGRIGGFTTNQKPLKVKLAKNRNPKGVMFAKIAKAQLESDLFSQNQKPDFYCWTLMYFIDYKAKLIRSEISCPSKMTPNGKYIEQYHKRIILPEISIDFDQEIEDSVMQKELTEELNIFNFSKVSMNSIDDETEELDDFDFPVTVKKEVKDV